MKLPTMGILHVNFVGRRQFIYANSLWSIHDRQQSAVADSGCIMRRQRDASSRLTVAGADSHRLSAFLQQVSQNPPWHLL